MFKVGDNAVYPSHGVGIIKRIDEKMISGQKKSFYVLQVIENGMTIMVPTDNTGAVGLRALVSQDEVDEVFGILRLIDQVKAVTKPLHCCSGNKHTPFQRIRYFSIQPPGNRCDESVC